MTRDEALRLYHLNEFGRIESPGKFEGQPLYAPAYWQLGLEGAADEEDGDTGAMRFHVDASDVEQWPELRGVKSFRLWESDMGFVIVVEEKLPGLRVLP